MGSPDMLSDRSYPARRSPLARAVRAAGTILCALLLTTCSDNPVGPGRPGFGTLRVQPGFDAYARLAPLVVDQVRVIVVRPPADTVQVINRSFSLSSNQLQIAQQLPLQASSEDFDVTVELYAGTILMFSGTSRVRVSQATTTAPQNVPVSYQGPGAQAAAISIAPRDTTLSFGAQFPFRATAVDGQQQPVPQFYVSWSLQTPKAGVVVNPAGALTVPARRDTVMLIATTPSGLADSTRVFFTAPPSTLVKLSGDGQSAFPGSRLSQPLAVQVNGTDGLPVAGVSVSFTAPAGGGVDSATATSDAQGVARTGATLGPALGPQSFGASASGAGSVSFAATAIGVQPRPVPIAAGGDHSCEIRGTSTVCWGDNANSQLGDGTSTDRLVATPVNSPQVFVSLALGLNHSCGLTAAGAGFCWGDNAQGQLGDGTTTASPQPVAVTGGQTFVRLSAGRNTTCGLTAAGQALCWGDNGSGQIGDGTQTNRSAPTAVAGGHTFVEIAVGGTHTCGITNAGAGFCWGDNSNGQLGDGTTTAAPQPVAVTGGHVFGAIALGQVSSCAIDSTGAALCWGLNFGVNLTAPAPVSGGFTYTALVMGDNHVCGLTASGWLCGGDNGGGQLGDGTRTDRPTPVAPSGGLSFSALAGGALHTCGLTATGTRCWGTNTVGQLGDGTQQDRLTPTVRTGPATSVTINSGNNQTGSPGSQLPVPVSVLVRDQAGNPMQGVEVLFFITAGNGTVAQPNALTDAAGINSADWTLGTSAGVNTLQAIVQSTGVVGNPATFTATAVTPSGGLTWTGAVSTDWSAAGNWNPAQVPTLSDSVAIGSAANPPTLSGASQARAVAILNGGLLTLNGQTLTVATGFSTSGTGVLSMLNAADVLVIGGNAVFDGGNELGQMDAGIISIGGNLTQLATNSPDSYHPSGTHLTVFAGASPVITFATPGLVPGSSHLQDFSWSAGGTLTLGSDVFAHGIVTLVPGTVAAASTHRLTVGQLAGTSVTFSNVELGIEQTAPTSLTLPSVAFTNMPSNATQFTIRHPGIAGTISFSGFTFTPIPAGSSGFYVAAVDADGIAPALDLSIGTDPGNGPAFTSVSGGATVTWQSGTTANVWTGSVSTNWNTAGNWSFGHVPLATEDVQINGAANAPVLTGSAAIRSLTIDPSGQLTVNGGPLTLSGNLDASGSVLGSAVVTFTGANATVRGTLFGVGLNVAAGAKVTLNGFVNMIGGDVTVAGELDLGGQGVVSDAAFSTSGSGILTMTAPGSFLGVTQANFAGGDETGHLVDGVLQTVGFSQSNAGGSASSFFASGTHTLLLQESIGTPTSQVSFTNPGSSRFQDVVLNMGSGQINLQSSVTVAGAVFTTSTSPPPVIQTTAPGSILTTGGVQLDSVTFDGVPLVISGAHPALSLRNVTFQNQSPTATQLTVNQVGQSTPFVFDSLTFLTTPTSGGLYLSAADIDGPSPDALTIDVTNSTPASGAPFVQVSNGAVVNWPPVTPAPTWTGAVSGDWFTPANWSTNAVPLSTDSVVITAAGTSPVLAAPVTIQAIDVQGGSLRVGGQTLVVTGTFRTSGTGILVMNNAADSVLVGADAIFGGGSTSGFLTAGTLIVAGDISDAGGSITLQASGSHQTVLNGTGPQQLLFTGLVNRFFNLRIENTSAPVTIPSGTVAVNNLLSIPVAATLTGAGTLSAGSVNTVSGSTLSVASLIANSPTLLVGGNFAVTTTTLFGGGSPPILPYFNLNQGGALDQTLNANLTITGTLGTGGNGGWILNGHTLTAAALSVSGIGYVTMTNSLDTLVILGDVNWGGGDETGKLTAGELQVGGNFSQLNSTTSFVASGTHVTRLINADKSVSFASPSGPTFNDLIVDMAGVATVSGQARVAGDLTVTSGGTLTGGNVLVSGNATVVPGSFLTVGFLEVQGAINSSPGAAFAPGVLHLSNTAGGVLPGNAAGFAYNSVVLGPLTGGGGLPFTMTGAVTLLGTMDIRSGLVVNGQTLTLGEDLNVNDDGTLTMTDPADLVVVARQTIFAGGDETGKLTAGTIQTAGNFQQFGTVSPNAFVASGTHTVELTTLSPFGNQLIILNPTTSHFQNLRVLSLTGFSTDVEVRGDLEINFNSANNLFAKRVTVGGALTKNSIGFLGIDHLFLSGDLNTLGGTILVDTLEFVGINPQTVNDNIGVGLGKVVVLNDVTWTNTPMNASGDVDITTDTGILHLPNGDLTVGGNFSITNAGLLDLASPTVQGVTVAGDALFDGGDETGLLDSGRFTFKGNFTQKATNSTSSFAAGPLSEAIFDADATISFDDPTKSRFGSVFITLGRTLTLASDVTVQDQTRGYNGGFLTGFDGIILGSGSQRWTTASLESAGATFDGVSLIVDDPSATVNGFSDLTFKNLPTTATQLTLRHPGPTYTLNNITFMPLAVNDTGFYLDLTDSDGSTPARLVVSVNHDPGNGASKTNTDGISSASWSP